MKRSIIIRDDDVNYFTDPAGLEALYGPLFARGLPVSLSVIPEVAADTPLALGEQSRFGRQYGLRHEPFIPPAQRGRTGRYALGENQRLVQYIRARPVEVVQHGFNHRWNGGAEFESADEAKLLEKIERGSFLLRETFGWRPEFFCPPWDRISRAGLRALRRAGFLGVTGRHFGRNLPVSAWPVGWWHRAQPVFSWRDFLFVGHPGYVLSLFHDGAEVLERFRQAYASHPVLVLVNHYWEYNFDGQPQPDAARLALWHAILDFILTREHEAQIISFRTLYDRWQVH